MNVAVGRTQHESGSASFGMTHLAPQPDLRHLHRPSWLLIVRAISRHCCARPRYSSAPRHGPVARLYAT
jgi:hypothetical protein